MGSADPGRELAQFELFREGYSALLLNEATVAFTSSRGFVMFESIFDELS